MLLRNIQGYVSPETHAEAHRHKIATCEVLEVRKKKGGIAEREKGKGEKY
jgi:hypothetical protein